MSNQYHLNIGKIISQDSIAPKLNPSLRINNGLSQGNQSNSKQHTTFPKIQNNISNNINLQNIKHQNSMTMQNNMNNMQNNMNSSQSSQGIYNNSNNFQHRGISSLQNQSLIQSPSKSFLDEGVLDTTARSQAKLQEKVMRTRHLETLEFLNDLKNSINNIENQMINLTNKCNENFGMLAKATERDLEKIININSEMHNSDMYLLKNIDSSVKEFRKNFYTEIKNNSAQIQNLNDNFLDGQHNLLNQTKQICSSLESLEKNGIGKVNSLSSSLTKKDLDILSSNILSKMEESADMICEQHMETEEKLSDILEKSKKIIDQNDFTHNDLLYISKQVDQIKDTSKPIKDNTTKIENRTKAIEKQLIDTKNIEKKINILDKQNDKIVVNTVEILKIFNNFQKRQEKGIYKNVENIGKKLDGVIEINDNIDCKADEIDKKLVEINNLETENNKHFGIKELVDNYRANEIMKCTETIDKKIQQVGKMTESIDKQTLLFEKKFELMEMKLNTLDKRAELIEKKTEKIDLIEKKIGIIEKKTEMVEKLSEAINFKTEAIDIRTESIDIRAESIDNRTESIDNRTESIDNRTESMDKRTESMDKRTESIDLGVNYLTERVEDIENLQLTSMNMKRKRSDSDASDEGISLENYLKKKKKFNSISFIEGESDLPDSQNNDFDPLLCFTPEDEITLKNISLSDNKVGIVEEELKVEEIEDDELENKKQLINKIKSKNRKDDDNSNLKNKVMNSIPMTDTTEEESVEVY